jgi:hypothetical protein
VVGEVKRTAMLEAGKPVRHAARLREQIVEMIARGGEL